VFLLEIVFNRENDMENGHEPIYGWFESEERGFGKSAVFSLSFKEEPYSLYQPNFYLYYKEEGQVFFYFPPYTVQSPDYWPQAWRDKSLTQPTSPKKEDV
jgi:hypothetical protein